VARRQLHKERNVRKSIGVALFVSAVMIASAAAAEGMLVDAAADKVIKKFEAATCDQLKAQKDEPPSEKKR
jgi:hypothetical protein